MFTLFFGANFMSCTSTAIDEDELEVSSNTIDEEDVKEEPDED